jgi:hypothetical protein
MGYVQSDGVAGRAITKILTYQASFHMEGLSIDHILCFFHELFLLLLGSELRGRSWGSLRILINMNIHSKFGLKLQIRARYIAMLCAK